MIRVDTQTEKGRRWIDLYRGRRPLFACVLGFTETASIAGISAAGATPEARRYTCLADGEFFFPQDDRPPSFPLPSLANGVSPAFISRAIVEALEIPIRFFDAGCFVKPSFPAIDLGGRAARCLTAGKALPRSTVRHLFQQGLAWGEKLAEECDYLVLGECVVGGTTTAQALLSGLGIAAQGQIGSSHPRCNHEQKQAVVAKGLANVGEISEALDWVAAVGDPMQAVATGMTIAASRSCGVLLAGGTQMLAVFALTRAVASDRNLFWKPDRAIVGTTRWVADDTTGDAIGLARKIPEACLLAARLDFSTSRYPQLRAYERGFVKEGVGAGGCAIAANLYRGWNPKKLLAAVEELLARYS